jgi:hypothetical protein
VHVAPACAGSREGSDHFVSYVRRVSLLQEVVSRLNPWPHGYNSQGNIFTTVAGSPSFYCIWSAYIGIMFFTCFFVHVMLRLIICIVHLLTQHFTTVSQGSTRQLQQFPIFAVKYIFTTVCLGMSIDPWAESFPLEWAEEVNGSFTAMSMLCHV